MGLKPHEIEAAHMEATVLKNLSHPNIGFLIILVSYYNSFCEKNILIIVMEYCEEGDMAFHIKLKRKSNKYIIDE